MIHILFPIVISHLGDIYIISIITIHFILSAELDTRHRRGLPEAEGHMDRLHLSHRDPLPGHHLPLHLPLAENQDRHRSDRAGIQGSQPHVLQPLLPCHSLPLPAPCGGLVSQGLLEVYIW